MVTKAKTLEMPKMVEATAFELLKTVQLLEGWRSTAHIIFFSTAIISLFTKDYALYISTIIAFVARAVAFILRLQAKRRNTLGHSLLRISMLSKAYKMNGDHFDVAYLLSKIPPRIHQAALEAAESSAPSGEYASPTDVSGARLLRWMIQENAFFNAILYDACANRALRVLLIFTALLVLFVLLVIPMTDGTVEYMFLRIFLMILSLAILYDQVERWTNWQFASRMMLDLENELARFENVPDHRILLLFSNYQIVICNTPEIKPNIYQDNRDKLNAGWRQRKATLHEEWSNET